MAYDELLELKRDVPGVAIPQGTATLLFDKEKVYLMQTLGGSFTVQRDNGQLVRVAGKDAEALGKEVPAEAVLAEKAQAKADGQADEKAVWDVLRTCFDPEIPVNIVELGLVYACRLLAHPEGGSSVDVVMTLTAPGCGMADVLKEDVEVKLRQLPGVTDAHVDVVFDPPWDRSMMTEAAKLQLGML
jgi:probable FeS assembly SUF system protein SufT